MTRAGRRAELTGKVLDGRYALRSVIGVGSTAVVFAAEDRREAREVAIKLLKCEYAYHPDVVRRTRREAEVGRTVAHPGTVPCWGEGTLRDGSPYLVMERVEGESLADMLARMGSLCVVEALRVTARVASILHAVHAAGYVHRDIKPEHVLLSMDARDHLVVRLLDFGVCHPLDLHPMYAERERGRVYGTPGYASPEQAAGHVDVDGRSDLYGLGATLFETLTGRRPLTGRNVAIVLRRTLELDAPSARELVPHIPPEVEALTADLLARSRHHRPPNARAVERRVRAMVPEPATVERALARQLRAGQARHLATTVGEQAPALAAP